MSPDELIESLSNDKRVRYVVFQKERGEERGTEHYQGYIEFKQSMRFAGVSKVLPRAHIELRKGTREQARDYCLKQDSQVDGPWEYGEFTIRPGSRTDLEALYKAARTSETLTEVAEAHPSAYLKYYKAVQHVRQLGALDKPKRTTDLQVILLYGPPGLGKTHLVREILAPDVYVLPLKTGKTMWFDNYRGERDALIDDFSGKLSLDDLLQLFDKYPVQVPIKGGYVYWCPDRIFVTTNVHPRIWYDYSKRTSSYRALTRRITSVYVFSDATPRQYEDLDEEAMINFFNP